MATYQVLFDGDCAFCQYSLAILHKLDWLGRLRDVNVRDQTQPILQRPEIQAAPLLDQIHVLTPTGRLLGGYAAMRSLAWHLPLLWLIAPLLYLPGVTFLGDWVYRWVARNRFQLIPCQHGACEIKRKQEDIHEQANRADVERRGIR